MEEGGPEKREVLELLQGDRLLHQLPIRIDRKELEDELVRVGKEVVILKEEKKNAIDNYRSQ